MTMHFHAPIDVTEAPGIDCFRLGFEGIDATGDLIEFAAVTDPINGWNVTVTCSTETMREIYAIMRKRAGALS